MALFSLVFVVGGVVWFGTTSSTESPQAVPVISPANVYPPPSVQVYPAEPPQIRQAYPDRPVVPVYPEHQSSEYRSHEERRR